MRKFRLNRSSTWNKEFEIRVILLVLFVSQFTLSYQKVYSSELAKNEFAINLFSQKIHPFLQKNCAECHSENSVYPAGAVHSHSNPALALETFSRFVDWSNPQNSRIVKMAKSQHFCSKYGYGCETAEKIGIEASLLIQDFVKSLKENTNTIKISNATGLNSRFLNEIDTQDISPSQDLYSFETQPISVTENMKSLYFDIGGGIEYVPRETLFLQMH
ncbi:MAG: hypothetical protein KDD35_03790, partial [Bdellovibrionales bacterium]|nr:hypothetical protein [Bdellovibrionales bacterium]